MPTILYPSSKSRCYPPKHPTPHPPSSFSQSQGAVRYIYVTSVGDGPRKLDPVAASLADADGMPKMKDCGGEGFDAAL